MSNRSLMEFNHDRTQEIFEDTPGFIVALDNYLANASKRNVEALKHYGIRIFGMRHHSEPFFVKWGAHESADIITPPTTDSGER
jgi:hypothetical protein